MEKKLKKIAKENFNIEIEKVELLTLPIHGIAISSLLINNDGCYSFVDHEEEVIYGSSYNIESAKSDYIRKVKIAKNLKKIETLS